MYRQAREGEKLLGREVTQRLTPLCERAVDEQLNENGTVSRGQSSDCEYTGANDGTDLYESLNGQTALVTGATRGIGEGIAARLTDLGATVYAGARSTDDVTTSDQRPVRLDGSRTEWRSPPCRRGGRESPREQTASLRRDSMKGQSNRRRPLRRLPRDRPVVQYRRTRG